MAKPIISKVQFNNRIVFRIAITVIVAIFLFGACNTKSAENKTAQSTELDGLKVPAGFSIERVAAPDMVTYPMFASFDNQGRLFVFESDGSTPSTEEMLKKPCYLIRLLEDTNADGVFDKSKIFADSLTFPKGGVFYKGSLYVTASPDLLRITDTDGDGVADKREVILSGWVLNHNGALLGGPFLSPDGWMYLTDARRGFNITTKEGENLKGKTARIWRCRPDGTGLESMVGGGYDNAVELAFMPSGETIGTMTYFIEPQGGMRDAIMHWVEGGVYPKPLPVIAQDKLILTGDLMPVMTKMARVSPSGIMRYRGSTFGKEFTGNIFTAEFNTGRIMRHIITPTGATYKTVDEPFITATKPDIHLTDVLEDADGSMLVLNTGGWFIAGCPLSRVAKLDVHGGLYRIRKSGTERFNDAWGNTINFKSLTAKSILKHSNDLHPLVFDKLIEQMVEAGEPSISLMKNSILQSKNEEIRAAGVFGLYQLNTPVALTEVRHALNDTSIIVRTAAARVLGLAKDRGAVDKLMKIVGADKSPVCRQAATALGQIGDIRAVSALLNASAESTDRFVEHAIIYALIKLKDSSSLTGALTHTSINVRRTALIALDQMGGVALKKENLAPFLHSENTQLRNTGIWVALHHPGWADIVIDFLNKRLAITDTSITDDSAIRELMISFSGNKQLQNLIAVQLQDESVPAQRKAFLLDVIGHSTVKETPEVWVHQLEKLLQKGGHDIRMQVMALIELRNIKQLNNQLNLIIQDPANTSHFRLKALHSRLLSEPKLSTAEFNLVSQYLDKKNESPIKQLAAQVMASARLTNTQLIKLANEDVSKVDNFLLPSLINAFESGTSKEVGESLIASLQSSSNRMDNLSEQDLRKLFQQYPSSVKTSAEPLMVSIRERNATRLTQLHEVESHLKKGDVGQGRKLFFGKGICASCHAVAGQGSNFAPDLTNIGQIRSKHDILEAILFPSASFAREHETSKIITKSITHNGIIKDLLPEAIVLATGPGQNIRIQRADILGIEQHNISMMPPALDKQLTTDELSDLMAYLTSLPDGMGGRRNEH